MEECVTKCLVQLLLIGIIKDIVENFLPQLSDKVEYKKFLECQFFNVIKNLSRLLNFLEVAFKFSSDFNEQIYLRYCLWQNGSFYINKSPF